LKEFGEVKGEAWVVKKLCVGGKSVIP